MRVLRLSVQLDWRAARPGPGPVGAAAVGGQAAQVARLTAALDGLGVEQELLVAPLADTPAEATVGTRAAVRTAGSATAAGVHRRAAAWAAAVTRELRDRAADVDVVHVHASGLTEPLAVAALVPVLAGTPLVLTLHCSAQATYRAQSRKDAVVQVVTRAAERRAIAAAARTTVLTQRTRAQLAGQGRVEVLPDAVDAAAIARSARDGAVRARAEAGVPDGAPLVAFVGRLSVEKGAGELPALARRLAGRGAWIVACGAGPLEEELRAAAPERLVLAGPRSAEEVAGMLGAADVLVLPSHHEELGSVLLEAQAAGTPSVAFAVGGTPEAIADGRTGLLVAPGDGEALARAVERVLSDEELRRRAAAEGPARAAERFDTRAIAAQLLRTYEEVVSGVR